MIRAILASTLAVLLLAPSAAHAKRVSITMTFGQDVLIAGKEDLNVRAQCVLNEGGMGIDYLRIYAVTQNNAVLRGSYSGFNGNGSYLTALTPVTSSIVASMGSLTGIENFANVIDSGFVLNLTTKHGFAFGVESTLMGLNSGTPGCTLSIDLQAIKKFKAAN